MKHIEQAKGILTLAHKEHNPVHVVALSSWGNDSQVSTDIAHQWATENNINNFTVVTLDTGISADGYIEFARQQGKRYPRFEVWNNNEVGFNWYSQNAVEHGFGYTKAHHTNFYYRMLKERTIRKVIQHFKGNERFDRVMLISGVYRQESPDRHNIPEVSRNGAGVWVAPIVHWNKLQIAQYRADNELPHNPFYETVGGSGDCQCNWGNFIDLPKLNEHSPKLASKIKAINQEVIDKHGWGWGEKPSESLKAERRGQLTLTGVEPLVTPNLCASCQRSKPHKHEAEEDILVNRMKW